MLLRSPAALSLLLAFSFTGNGCFDGLAQVGDAGAGTGTATAQAPIRTSGMKGKEPSFAGLTKSEDFYSGTIIASDPSIVKTGNGYRVFYTDLDVSTNRTVLATATSQDGHSWATQGRENGINGLVIRGRSGKWDENIESGAAVLVNGSWKLYFSGYRDEGDPFRGFPASLGLATSSDGQNFERVSSDPIISPTRGWYDNDAVYSPTVLYDGGTYYMIYVGHAYTNTSKIGAGGAFLIGARSNDGRTWYKEDTPIARPGQFGGWRSDGLAEPYLVKKGPGEYLLFFTGLSGERRALGVGTAANPLGPYTFGSNPIVKPGPRGAPDEHQVLAPAAVIEGGELRLWYLAANRKELLSIGYADGNLAEVLQSSK